MLTGEARELSSEFKDKDILLISFLSDSVKIRFDAINLMFYVLRTKLKSGHVQVKQLAWFGQK